MDRKLPKIIVAAVIKKEDKYLLIKEKLSDGTDYWILPGGTVEFGENLEDAIVREIKEEINLKVKVVKLITFKEAIFPAYNYHTIIFFHFCEPLSKTIKLEEGILDCKYFTKADLKNEKLVDSAKWLFENFRF